MRMAILTFLLGIMNGIIRYGGMMEGRVYHWKSTMRAEPARRTYPQPLPCDHASHSARLYRLPTLLLTHELARSIAPK